MAKEVNEIKNPNGYGTVYKLSGVRRKPWIARVPFGRDKITEKRIYKTIGYFEKCDKALIALAEYNKKPYDLDAEKITFSEIYQKWSTDKFLENCSQSNINGYKKSFKDSAALHTIRMKDIRFEHLKFVMDNCNKNYPMRRRLRLLWKQLYAFSMERDIVDKDYSAFVKLGENEVSEPIHIPFTGEEIEKLFSMVDSVPFVDTVLIMIYTGLRIGELLDIKSENVFLEERYLRGGLKTRAGINRVIPINKKIHPFVLDWLSKEHSYLVSSSKKKMSYYEYNRDGWNNVMEGLGAEHLPHDCRHTFATLMNNAGADKLCVKKIMGHASNDITEKVYTHKDIQELIDAVDLI